MSIRMGHVDCAPLTDRYMKRQLRLVQLAQGYGHIFVEFIPLQQVEAHLRMVARKQQPLRVLLWGI